MSMRYYKRRLAEAQKLVEGGNQSTPATSESVVEKAEVKPKKPGRPSKK